VDFAFSVLAIAFFAVAFLAGAPFAFALGAGFLTLLIAGTVSGKRGHGGKGQKIREKESIQ
jgi:hypothetical protein